MEFTVLIKSKLFLNDILLRKQPYKNVIYIVSNSNESCFHKIN